MSRSDVESLHTHGDVVDRVPARADQYAMMLAEAEQAPRDPLSQAAAAERVRIWLGIVLADPDISILELVAYCRALDVLRSGGVSKDAVWRELRRIAPVAMTRPDRLHPKVVDAMRAFESRSADIAVLREQTLGAALAISPAHLGRLLRVETGMGFRTWRLGARLRGAIGDLARSRQQIAQVAFQWGWSSPGQFTRQFHLLVGESPKAFRKRHHS